MKRDIFEFEFGIFDCDGTLIDSMSFYTETFVVVLEEKTGIPREIGRKFYKERAGTPALKQYEQILELYDKNKLADVREITELFFQRIDKIDKEKKFRVFPGTKKLLMELCRRGLKLFVTSGSKCRILERKLEKHDLLVYFDLIMGSDEILKGVEHIKIFADWCELPIEKFAKRAFLLGDGPSDMRIARESGVYAIGIANTVDAEILIKAGADDIVKNLKDLIHRS